MDYPDPMLTANIYCSGQLDEVICGVVEPLRRALEQPDSERDGYLWVMRYDKSGEHLKIRLHGPKTTKSSTRRLLADIVDSFLATLKDPEPAATEQEPVKNRSAIPSIDPEDDAQVAYADRSLLWTKYKRSSISLGSEPFLEDDHYVTLLTSCLGQGCEITLDALTAQTGEITHQRRQTTLLKALAFGIVALGLTAEKRAEYFRYHRDWLLRYALAISDSDSQKELETLTRFDQQVAGMGTALETLRKVMEADLPTASQGDFIGFHASWQQAIFELCAYVRPLGDNLAYHIDPFATVPVFAPMFKAFHGLANQLGIDRLNEALAHHILMCAARKDLAIDEPLRVPVRVQLVPDYPVPSYAEYDPS